MNLKFEVLTLLYLSKIVLNVVPYYYMTMHYFNDLKFMLCSLYRKVLNSGYVQL